MEYQTTPTMPIEYRISEPHDPQAVFLDHLEVQYRALMMQIRDVEKHLMRGGRISQSQLRPSRDR